MKVHIATDHAGLEFKDKLKSHLESQGHTVEDHGAYEYDASDDYPGFIIAAAKADYSVSGRKIPFGCTTSLPTVVSTLGLSG
jgi:ribose 5-phosphate isomerase RpiB